MTLPLSEGRQAQVTSVHNTALPGEQHVCWEQWCGQEAVHVLHCSGCSLEVARKQPCHRVGPLTASLLDSSTFPNHAGFIILPQMGGQCNG